MYLLAEQSGQIVTPYTLASYPKAPAVHTLLQRGPLIGLQALRNVYVDYLLHLLQQQQRQRQEASRSTTPASMCLPLSSAWSSFWTSSSNHNRKLKDADNQFQSTLQTTPHEPSIHSLTTTLPRTLPLGVHASDLLNLLPHPHRRRRVPLDAWVDMGHGLSLLQRLRCLHTEVVPIYEDAFDQILGAYVQKQRLKIQRRQRRLLQKKQKESMAANVDEEEDEGLFHKHGVRGDERPNEGQEEEEVKSADEKGVEDALDHTHMEEEKAVEWFPERLGRLFHLYYAFALSAYSSSFAAVNAEASALRDVAVPCCLLSELPALLQFLHVRFGYVYQRDGLAAEGMSCWR